MLFQILKNNRQLTTHNLRRPDSSYTARPGEVLECLLYLVCPTGGQDFALPYQEPAWNPIPGVVITPGRLTQQVCLLSLEKSPGPDNNTPAILRNDWELILPLFTKICQSCLKLGTIPFGWRMALKMNWANLAQQPLL